MREPKEGQWVMKGVVHRAHTTETQVEKDRTSGGHGSLVVSARAELEEEKGGLYRSYMSQKPDCKAKGEGWKIQGAQESQVCFIFTAGREEHVSILRGRSQWRPMEFGNGVGGTGLVSGAGSG